jgi:hypothetical protein
MWLAKILSIWVLSNPFTMITFFFFSCHRQRKKRRRAIIKERPYITSRY